MGFIFGLIFIDIKYVHAGLHVVLALVIAVGDEVVIVMVNVTWRSDDVTPPVHVSPLFPVNVYVFPEEEDNVREYESEALYTGVIGADTVPA
jgi:hypothetical protein